MPASPANNLDRSPVKKNRGTVQIRYVGAYPFRKTGVHPRIKSEGRPFPGYALTGDVTRATATGQFGAMPALRTATPAASTSWRKNSAVSAAERPSGT